MLTAISAMMGCVGFVTCQLWWIKGKGLSGLAGGGGGPPYFWAKGGSVGPRKNIFEASLISYFRDLMNGVPTFFGI